MVFSPGKNTGVDRQALPQDLPDLGIAPYISGFSCLGKAGFLTIPYLGSPAEDKGFLKLENTNTKEQNGFK